MDAAGMRALLSTVAHLVRVKELTGTRKNILDAMLRHVHRGDLAVLALGDHNFRYHRWLCVVGVEWSTVGASKQPTALLAVDSAMPMSRIAVFNGRLELRRPPDRRYLHYTDADGRIDTVVLQSVFALGRKVPK